MPDGCEPVFVASESLQQKPLDTKADLAVVVLSKEHGTGQDVIQRLLETFTGRHDRGGRYR